MTDFLHKLFSTNEYMPHGHCYLWQPGLLWTHLLSDASIALSYIAISTTLVVLVQKSKKELPFNWIFLLFGAFIVFCGLTHLMEVWTLWNAAYWFSGGLKIVTAVASVGTAVILPPLVPLVLKMVRDAKASEERRQDLVKAHGELTGLYDRLKEFDELKTQFFANVSHELRTPLALILGPIESLMSQGNCTGKQRRELTVIERNARLLLKHVNDLLDVSKLEAGKMSLHYVQIDLAALTRVTASYFENLAQERKMSFVVSAPDFLHSQMDSDRIQRVLLNLLSNAFKFTPEGGRVRCTLRDEDENGVLEVADSGPGISPNLRSAAFERFRQLEGGATRRFGGTGLGLSIVRDFVELHRGKVLVEEAPEGGALFRVTLPKTAPAGTNVSNSVSDEDSEVQRKSVAQAVDELKVQIETVVTDKSPDKATVLVVEDNPDMNRFLVESLSAEYRVVTAFDGQEGLKKAMADMPDLILSDVMMPRMSGDQLIEELRNRPAFDAIPIVLLTAKADDELRARLLKAGVQDYLIKPFSREEMLTRINNLIAVKRARDVLQEEVETQLRDLEVLAREVTSRKRELEMAKSNLQAARDRAEEANFFKTKLLRLVSHEFRTPLTTLQLQLQIMERDPTARLSPRQKVISQRIISSSKRLAGLVDALLNYAQIENGKISIHHQSIPVPSLIDEVVEELAFEAEQKNIELTSSITPGLTEFTSDPKLLRLILTNLVGNAVKFTEKGSVRLFAERVDGVLKFTVRDTGPGIPNDQFEKIFESFYQIESIGHKTSAGVGLGLALVKELVEALGGNIGLESKVGVGSVFVVTFPSTSKSPQPPSI